MRRKLWRRFGPYFEIVRAIKDNLHRPRYAWRILNDGVCDGCALGTTGMRDWTLDGTHLCWIRLNLLHLNTMKPFDPAIAADANRLVTLTEPELRKLGRLPVPMIRRQGDPGFTPLAWEEAIALCADRIAATTPDRLAFYVVSRGTANETYYAIQKSARFLGTNHVDNSARICHSPSTVGLKDTIGFAATTCSYRDLLETDLVVLIGSDVANNQPVFLKYLGLAKKRGARIAVLNPVREPGLDRYWIPSSPQSMILGTSFCDEHFPIAVGGDIPFLYGALKHLIADGKIDRAFIDEHTDGWSDLEAAIQRHGFEDLERASGARQSDMRRFAALYGAAGTAVLVWSMGVTMHRHGVDNVRAIAALGLARGNVGRPGSGLMPIRGHSGVQGGAEMGCVPNVFPGGHPVDSDGAKHMADTWGFPVPEQRGDYAWAMVDRAHRGELDVMYCVGSNLLGVLPDPAYTRQAVGNIPLRIHHDIVLNPQMLVDPADTVLLLPATTRYEMAGGNTETSTERRVIFNPEIPGPRVPGARDEWRVIQEIARRVRDDPTFGFETTAEIREEIARVISQYKGIQDLQRKGDAFQWGGDLLGAHGRFGTPNGRARFVPVAVPRRETPEGKFTLVTRRGKQFNSMVFGNRDSLVGAERDHMVLAQYDMDRLGLTEGDPVTLRSETGELQGRAFQGDVRPGTVMTYWPEANVLIGRDGQDDAAGMPAYRDAVVDVVPMTAARVESAP